MEKIRKLARENQRKAREIIAELDIEGAWKTIGAEAHLVGSLRMGLLTKHRDIDFHIYSEPVDLAESFRAVARLAAHPAVEKIECTNLLHTEEACVEWHARYRDADGECWQIDMIHIRKGSRYDGYFERMADRISAVLTESQRDTILRLKYETPDDEHIMGVEYYRAVIQDGVDTYARFAEWRKRNPVTGIVHWMP